MIYGLMGFIITFTFIYSSTNYVLFAFDKINIRIQRFIFLKKLVGYSKEYLKYTMHDQMFGVLKV